MEREGRFHRARRNLTTNDTTPLRLAKAVGTNEHEVLKPEFHVKIKIPSFTPNWRRILGNFLYCIIFVTTLPQIYGYFLRSFLILKFTSKKNIVKQNNWHGKQTSLTYRSQYRNIRHYLVRAGNFHTHLCTDTLLRASSQHTLQF